MTLMAWAERLASGRYRGCYRDGANRKRTVSGTFAHKAEARRVAGEAEVKVRKRLSADPEAYRRPWSEWRVEWWDSRAVEPSTLRGDKGRLSKHLQPTWDERQIGAINRQDVKAWIASLQRDGVRAETIRRCVHLFSASMNAAVDAEIIETNPAARLKLPKGELAQERFLTHDELDLLLAQLPTTRDQLIVKMLANTGLRWGEMAGLHWNRVDLKRGTLRVVETWDETAGQMKSYPKSRHVRDVPIPAWLVAELDELPITIGGCGHPHQSGKCRSGLVLTTSQGNVLRNSKWSWVWRRAVLDADIGHARVHDLRHTYASWLLQAGVPLAEVGRLLGHVSAATTQRYAHLAELPTAAVVAALPAPGAPDLPQTGQK